MEKRTKKRIRDTFIAMLEEESLDKITVKALISRCGMNRNTFYYYYQDIFAVLDDLLQQELEEAAGRANHSFDSWQEGFLNGIRFSLEHRQAVCHAYHSKARDYVTDYLSQVAEHFLTAFVEQEAAGLPDRPLDRKILVDFYRHALTGIVTDWLQGNMQDNLSANIQRLGVLLEGNIRASLEKGIDPPS